MDNPANSCHDTASNYRQSSLSTATSSSNENNCNDGCLHNAGSNSNNGEQTEFATSTNFFPNYDTRTKENANEGNLFLAQSHQAQPLLGAGSVNMHWGLLDPRTRLLLETILRLDDHLRGGATNAGSITNDTSMSSTALVGQHILSQSSQPTGNLATGSSSGAISVAPPISLMLPGSSSTSSSSEEETVKVPCRARGQPPEHNYLSKRSEQKERRKTGKSSASKQKQLVPQPNDPTILNSVRPVATTIPQHDILAAAPTDAFESNINAVSSLLDPPFEESLIQDQTRATVATNAIEKNDEQRCNNRYTMRRPQHAIDNATKVMEEVSRLGDSSSSTSTNDGNAIRFPCRARGMPLNHTTETAYLTISKNMNHGDELVCSHPSCNFTGGVKFCWCHYCQIPVAKRNFRIRHNHGDMIKPPNMIEEQSDRKEENSRSRKRQVKEQDVSSPSGNSDLSTQSSGARPARIKENGNSTTTRREMWLRLLESFPTTGDDNSKQEWLARVLLVSDKKTRRMDLRPDVKPKSETIDLAAFYFRKVK
ncbi:hypothetical protein IV203_016922 [Nitzschia inconspicua]|uniref:Uncharacterized protein n=1 Tax=Nitzschia inconspicua TaxID=303405 RepID=A0A9K3KRK1_9STRA|nr:hypothetical protein IV203_016922 [Nitzschia inconspicua]